MKSFSESRGVGLLPSMAERVARLNFPTQNMKTKLTEKKFILALAFLLCASNRLF